MKNTYKKNFLILTICVLVISFIINTHTKASDYMSTIKIKVSVGDKNLTATLYDNATTRAFIKKLPLTLNMMDLYSREMCYRFNEALPTDNVKYTDYNVGEIIYWPPGHSFCNYVQTKR